MPKAYSIHCSACEECISPIGCDADLIYGRMLREFVKRQWPVNWFGKLITSCVTRNSIGVSGLVAHFSLERNAVPMFTTSRVPWQLIKKNLSSRIRLAASEEKRKLRNEPYCPWGDNYSMTPVPLGGIDAALDILRRGPSAHFTIQVDCCPISPYILQLVVFNGHMTALLHVDTMHVSDKYGIGWLLTEGGILAHYCAKRLGVFADRLALLIGLAIASSKRECMRTIKATMNTTMVVYPKVIFRRFARSIDDWRTNDVTICGYDSFCSDTI
ncbi:UL44.5 [anatid alphaherpesvirus 1]|uniref:UL44.5 n=1 Tax=anatid alphaherpesvirus 1 TaxID=104388 RepID=G3GQZ5_9ALPH|nr:UL44.5 [Anatid alphaherpesvirus 1]AEN80081.1 UL44.5 [Anatid alphaherpesvirus 1]QOL71457.1 UL44.5 [Anatid alphaherpesvirus 1]UEC79296.1 UL44.5 [Anatid alphaherpesvirus 1]UJO49809.1 UL44.5 [Anatid alphaherpesvirus 1]UJO49884.1 UL44.5 [Anatid alphaherpesvirus 1]